MSHHNIRIMRNLCVDGFQPPWSTQFVMGGPVYWIRNVYYGVTPGFKAISGSVGHYNLHNTSVGGKPSVWPPARSNVGPQKLEVSDKDFNAGNLGVNPGYSAGIFTRPPEIAESGLVPTVFENGDFMPAADSPAIDKGIDILPNVNDDFAGKAPDLGAIEFDKPLPHYGPRTTGTAKQEQK